MLENLVIVGLSIVLAGVVIWLATTAYSGIVFYIAMRQNRRH